MPQIEVMLSDLPHTLYTSRKKRKDEVTVDDEALRLQEEANRRAAERRSANGERSYSLEEIFAGKAD